MNTAEGSPRRAPVYAALFLGLGLGWFLGAWAWTRFAPYSATRLAEEAARAAAGADGWFHAPHPLDPGGAKTLRPTLETVLASALASSDGRPLEFSLAAADSPGGASGTLSLQLLDDRGLTYAVLHSGESLRLEPEGPRVWCLARARILPGETPDDARARIAAIELPGARGSGAR